MECLKEWHAYKVSLQRVVQAALQVQHGGGARQQWERCTGKHSALLAFNSSVLTTKHSIVCAYSSSVCLQRQSRNTVYGHHKQCAVQDP